jgi:hypothetical protein
VKVEGAFVDSHGSNAIGWYRPSSSRGWLNDMALPPSAQLDEQLDVMREERNASLWHADALAVWAEWDPC